MFPNTRYSQEFEITEAAVSEPAKVTGRDFQNVSLYAVGSDTASFKIRVLGSYQETPPDFSAASSPTNEWGYIQLKDVNDSGYEDGDAGYTFTTDETKQFELNTTGLNWYAIEVFDYLSGQLNAKFMFKNNV